MGTGILASLGAATLFGVSAPLAKLLLAEIHPVLLAAFLYCGSGIGLTLVALARRARGTHLRETPIRSSDLTLLAGVILAGGIAAPCLLLFGLARVSGVVGSLLLNLETPFTILLAVGLLSEHLSGRAAVGAALTVGGGALLASGPGDVRADWLGALAIVLACLAWALDNNMTQRLSLRDPVLVALAKGWGAGVLSLALALGAGATFPAPTITGAGMALGFVSYGISFALAVRAMRTLGAARHAAIFATGPFIGAMAAVPVLGEAIGAWEAGAGALMAVGLALILAETHAHWHSHEALAHEHAHSHDEHHRHGHADGWDGTEPHSHVHEHVPLSHVHPHVSDLHHRHRH